MTTATEAVELVEASFEVIRDRLERRLAGRVARVFRAQRQAFPGKSVARAALDRFAAPLQEAPNTDDALAQLVLEFWRDGEEELAQAVALEAARAAGTAGNLTLARIGYAASFTVGVAVRDRIATGSLAAATRIEEESRRRIRVILARGIDAGLPADAVARQIRQEFTDWTRPPGARGRLTPEERRLTYRAQRIARTEIAEAWESTQYEVMARNGWQGRQWLTARDERVDGGDPSGPCVQNEAAGVVAIDRPFPSGVYYPPQHPLCRCTVVPAEGWGPGQAAPEPWTGGDSGGAGDVRMPERSL